ncbi:FAD binding domain-containing protein [Biscogniauxia marginata]|nr:FAD binding domain-containing protein [Biscogniauxia marginata]
MLLRSLPVFAGLVVLGSSSYPNLTSITEACNKYKYQIQGQLSPNSIVQCGGQNERWSEYSAPLPGAIITVGSEDDVARIVAFASKQNIPFLLQSGANGWADTFTLDTNGIIIDVSQLKEITFNSEKTQVTFQAGVTNADMVKAAWNNNVRVQTSTCNCVSLLGATLGGGLSRTQGLYGLDIDQIISVNIIDANGNKKTVTPQSDADLWWALQGAGANFGIVTSVVFKSYPVSQAENTAWTGSVVFDQSKIEDVIGAIDSMTFEPEMQLDLYYASMPPNYEPAVIVLPFYLGSEEIGKQKFAPILNIGPAVDATEVIPYNTWNDAGDSFCAPGGRKPSYTVGLKAMDPSAWRNVWNEYTSFLEEYPEAGNSSILTECYSTANLGEIDISQSAYPFRDIKCYAVAIPWYAESSLDDKANEFGQRVRSYWAASAGTEAPSSYINFAHGDEPLDQIYGSSLPRLQQLKQKYDPKKRFNQWFPLS